MMGHPTALCGRSLTQWMATLGIAGTVPGTRISWEAARCGHLPEGFERWDLANKYGTTVAHVAARCGHLPEGSQRRGGNRG